MRSVKKNTDLLKKYYADSLPMLQANLYTTLIEGRIPEEEMPHYFKLPDCFYRPVVLLPDHTTSASQVPEGMDIRPFGIGRPAGRENLGKNGTRSVSLSWGYHYDYAVKK